MFSSCYKIAPNLVLFALALSLLLGLPQTARCAAGSDRNGITGAKQPAGSTAASNKAEPEINSYIDYLPAAAEYPPPLAPAVKQLADAIRQSAQARPAAGKPAETDNSRFKAAAETLARLKSTTARGFQDELNFLQGYAAENLGDNRQALAFYDQSLGLRSDNVIASFRRGVVLIKTGDYEKALNQFKEIEWRSPAFHHEVYFEIADCLMHLNKKDEAVKYIEKAHQADPAYIPVLRQLVRMKTEMLVTTYDPAQRSQLERQILGELGQILERSPDDRDVGLEYAGLLLKFSDPLVDSERIDRAVDLSKHFAESSDYGDERAVMMLFDSLLKKGDIEAAEKALKRGLLKHPHSANYQSGLKQLKIERGVEG